MKPFVFMLALLLTACSSIKPMSGRAVLCADDWVSYDGKTMPWKSWPAPDGVTTKGVVIAVHGLSGAKSDFWYLGDQLPKRGYAVYAYDLRGQGNDPVVVERGDISGEKVWQRDLATFHALVKRRHPKKPVFWYGESLGSLIALHTAADLLGNRSDPQAIIAHTRRGRERGVRSARCGCARSSWCGSVWSASRRAAGWARLGRR